MTKRDYVAVRVLYFPASAGLLGWAMTLRRPFAPLFLFLAALALTGCGDAAPDYRYRLTVEVETPEGLRSGSSVIQVRQTLKLQDSKPVGVRRRVSGEAVAIDLPNGSTLFALLRGEDLTNWTETIMGRIAPDVEGEPYVERLDDMLFVKGEVTLPRTFPPYGPFGERSAYPMLVTFADINDPTSVELVDADDLVATFGEGYALQRITVQITDDPVTTGIERRLDWLNRQVGSLVRRPKDAPIGEMPIEHRLTEIDFRQGAN